MSQTMLPRTTPAPAAANRHDRHIDASLLSPGAAGAHRGRYRFPGRGGYALERYLGIGRLVKDLDLFLRAADVQKALDHLSRRLGCDTELTFPHWLGKVRKRGDHVDLIFNAGNGVCVVDDEWFNYAVPSRVLDVPVLLCPVEEMIWSKAFVMERERYDGADVAHLLHACAGSLDWDRLSQRFGKPWRILFAHLTLFGFIYPSERRRIPRP
jgi:hypothetical protein